MRLRFRAGLLRLDARELIEYRPSLTTGEVADAVGSPAFERVGADFDAIAYGGRPAGEQDEAASRDGWERVLSEAGRSEPAAAPPQPRRPRRARGARAHRRDQHRRRAIDALTPSPSGPASSSFATPPEGVAAWAALARRDDLRVRALRAAPSDDCSPAAGPSPSWTPAS